MRLTKWASLISVFTGLVAPAISATRLTMTIRILDQANLRPNKIQKMERYVEHTLAAIEVDVTWVDCAQNVSACKEERGPNEFWLRILAQRPPDASGGVDVLGFTQHGDTPEDRIQCVNIFYPMVEQISERVGADSHQILGAAVVHEIGHLYLGTNSLAHSPTGVMRGAWSHREFEMASIGELNFSREQGERIRTVMSAASGL